MNGKGTVITTEPKSVLLFTLREGGEFQSMLLPEIAARWFLDTVRAFGKVPRRWLDPSAQDGETVRVYYAVKADIVTPLVDTWDSVLGAPRLL